MSSGSFKDIPPTPKGRNVSVAGLSVREAAELGGCSDRAIRKACSEGRLKADKTVGNGGAQYRIDLESQIALYNLNPIEVARWQTKRVTCLDPLPEGEKARAIAHNDRERTRGREAIEAGKVVPRVKLAPVAIDDPEEVDALWEAFHRATPKNRQRATKGVAMLMAFNRMNGDGKKVDSEIIPALRAEFGKGASKATIWRMREVVKGQRRDIWAPLLLADWKGKTAYAEIPEQVWHHFMQEWGTTSGASVRACYDRTLVWAGGKGFDTLPSCDTFEDRVSKIPLPVRVMLRQGNKALEELYPPMRRNYLSLKVHEIWSTDGHEINIFGVWPDGHVGRPVILGWEDLRTRVILGWRVGKTENADLVRLSFKDAAETSKAIPEYIQPDNGHAFADKGNTGGAPSRYRGKVKDDDPLGVITSLGIGIMWARPGNGREKPIESAWRLISQRVAQRPEFVGAYCGKDALSKPEDFDKAKAVPIEKILAAIAEEIELYHARIHRGDGMEGKTPYQLYEELIQHTPVRQVTARQLSACLMRRESAKPDRNGVFTVLKNQYWSDKTVGLERVSYTAAYDPDDLHAGIEIWKGERFICTAEIYGKSGFRDHDAMRNYKKSRNEWKKARKRQADAAMGLIRAELADVPKLEPDDTERSEFPKPKVVTPVRPGVQTHQPERPLQPNDEVLPDEEIERLAAAARKRKLRAVGED